MIENLTRLMVNSGAEWVLWLLFGLSIGSVAVALDRVIVLRRAMGDVVELVTQLRRLLRQGNISGAKELLTKSSSVPGNVVHAGLNEMDLGVDAAQSAMNAALGLERARLEKRLLFLGTVGNNAPFVGLLGTVIGVVGAFDELGKPQALSASLNAASSLAPERVMGTIAEALVATAVGLVVAIPAVAAYNALQARVARALADAETLGQVLLVHLNGGARRTLPPTAVSKVEDEITAKQGILFVNPAE